MRTLCALLFATISSLPVFAQISGSTTIQIDPNTSIVTATCETDLNSADDGYYAARVTCVVKDASGNLVASGAYSDDGDRDSYALVTLTFTGVPGMGYTATGGHSAELTVPFDEPDGGQIGLYYDELNFESFTESPDTYENSYVWEGPGPDEETRRSVLLIGNTTAAAVLINIVYTGQTQSLNGTTEAAVTGQQIALSAVYSLPSGISVQSQSWSVPGTTVGGYTASVNSGATSATNFSQPSTTFYWVDAGNSRSVTFTLNITDGTGTWQSTATVPFNVSGPTSPAMTAQLNSGGMTIDLVGDNVLFELGNATTTFGIIFTPTVIQPSGTTGTFSYVQLITAENEAITDAGPPVTNFTCSIGTGLDNFYPYPMRSDGTAADSPGVSLNSTYTDLIRTFSATMYLMWNSGLPNSIPIPLGSMQWGFSGDAYRDSTDSIWNLRNQSSAAQLFTPGITYPTWSTHASNNQPQCH
jgi:hypothetical protein